jgi:hypothetical protein
MKKLSLRKFINLPKACTNTNNEDGKNISMLRRGDFTNCKYPSSLSDTKLNSIKSSRPCHEWRRMRAHACHTPSNFDYLKSHRNNNNNGDNFTC